MFPSSSRKFTKDLAATTSEEDHLHWRYYDQFIDQKFRGFLTSHKVKHHFTSIEHPKANGQVEAANKVILRGLKKRFGKAKGAWADELGSILWSYRTTPHLTIGETPFKLTYGVDTMRPVEVEELSPRVIFRQTDSTSFREESDLANKVKETTHIRESALKHRIA